MRLARYLPLLALLLLFRAPVQAQDAELTPEQMLDRYLHFPDQREEMRPLLLALGAERLEQLIRDYPRPPAPEPGEHKFETECPDGFKRPYWITIPADYDADKPAALLVCLHGGVMAAKVDAGVSIMRWYNKYLREHDSPRPVVTLATSADCYETWMNAAWWRDAGRQNILHFIRQAKLRLNIDPEHVFITGFSDGGSGTLSMAFNSPDAFAGFLPMCGDPLIPPTDGIMHAYTNLKGANIHAFNGAKDPIYPGKEVEKLYKEANKQGASIDWFIHPTAGHDWGDPDETFPVQLSYLDKWTRPPVPDSIDWTADRALTGRRGWISIDECGELPKAQNKAKKPVAQKTGYRIDLGIKVPPNDNPNLMEDPIVGHVDRDSIAEKMGVKDGDHVVKCEGKEVTSFSEIRMLLSQKRAGDDISLTVKRDGELHTFTGTIPRQTHLTVGRIEAKRASTINVEVCDVKRFSVWVTSDMLNDKGALTIKLNKSRVFDGKVEPDPAVLLDEFSRSGDRRPLYIARVQIDVAEALGK
ncbi:MAG: PDZ domain-containing protein [Planctomycetes bacterium]|nr:PDZ domain-containing protein [Planctomycetota bacterium]